MTKHFIFGFLAVGSLTLCNLCGSVGEAGNRNTLPQIFEPLSVESLLRNFNQLQNQLLNALFTDHTLPFVTSAPAKLLKMTTSQASSFAAITQAMDRTRLYDGNSLLSLVAEIISVSGQNEKAVPAEQFNIAVRWKKNILTTLVRSGFTYRVGWGHSGEWGLSYHSWSHGLHLLFEKQNSELGHVHVDYRFFTPPVTMEEGHFGSYNSDVRAVGPEIEEGKPINNYLRHREWFGPIPGYTEKL